MILSLRGRGDLIELGCDMNEATKQWKAIAGAHTVEAMQALTNPGPNGEPPVVTVGFN